MTEHTPTPWRKHISEGRGVLCIVSDDAWICGEMHNPNGDMSEEEADANAAFIVKACNSHDALIAALWEIHGLCGACAAGDELAGAIRLITMDAFSKAATPAQSSKGE